MIGYRDMMIGDMMIKTDSLELIESQATKNTLYKVGRALLGPVSRTTPLILPNCVSTTNQLQTSVEFFQYIPGVRSTNSPMILIPVISFTWILHVFSHIFAPYLPILRFFFPSRVSWRFNQFARFGDPDQQILGVLGLINNICIYI